MELSKRQFLYSLLLIFLLLAISILIIFTISSHDDSNSKSTTYDTMYESNQDNNIKICKLKAKNLDTILNFNGSLGKDLISMRRRTSGAEVNSLWLTGDKQSDSKTLYTARVLACENKIPVIVIACHPEVGYYVTERIKHWNYYRPKSSVDSWFRYDRLLDNYISVLQHIPSLVIFEPDLFMILNDQSQDSNHNNQRYLEEFLLRVMKVVMSLKRSWVYVDVGNAVFMKDNLNSMNDFAVTLSRVPGLRGFVINTMHFMSDKTNEHWARKLYCRTGLHYIIDTSRNGGSFSDKNANEVLTCIFDPPHIKQGKYPGWSWGCRQDVDNKIEIDGTAYNKPLSNDPISRALITPSAALQIVKYKYQKITTCLETQSTSSAQDASVWIKTPGDADGRLYTYGEYHPCLIDHSITCSGSCQMITPILKDQKPKDCNCQTNDYQ